MYTILGYLYFVSANFHVCCAVYQFFSMAGLLFYFILLTEHSMSPLQNNLIFQSLQVSGVINLGALLTQDGELLKVMKSQTDS